MTLAIIFEDKINARLGLKLGSSLVHFSILWEYVHGWLSFRRGLTERKYGVCMQHTKVKGNSLVMYRIKRLIIFLILTKNKAFLKYCLSVICKEFQVPMNEIVKKEKLQVLGSSSRYKLKDHINYI